MLILLLPRFKGILIWSSFILLSSIYFDAAVEESFGVSTFALTFCSDHASDSSSASFISGRC